MWEKCWVNRWNMEHAGIVGKHRETDVIPEKHRECQAGGFHLSFTTSQEKRYQSAETFPL
jgi:hypothetical protein